MSLLDLASRAECWESFYTYKAGLACPKNALKELRSYIDRAAYLSVYESVKNGDPFPLPERSVISKMSSGKKRVVYTYPHDANMFLKLLTWLILRKYDDIFPDVLYSFRPRRTAKDAVLALARTKGISGMYAYKADVSDYFNSIPVELLLPDLKIVLADDPELYGFLSSLLLEPDVLDRGERLTEKKGIMAGTPQSSFYADLYLRELDKHFADACVPYARYSDDIILFADNASDVSSRAEYVREFLAGRGLSLNPAKEELFSPCDGWVFLGFKYCKGRIDIAPASLVKLKAKMRRKARALERWRKRNDLDGEKSARAFIRIFNRKLFENASDNELTWAMWFFPVINTSESLRELDVYAQDCIRFLFSGKRTKSRFDLRYEQMKELGYRSLVNEYYKFRKDMAKRQAEKQP